MLKRDELTAEQKQNNFRLIQGFQIFRLLLCVR